MISGSRENAYVVLSDDDDLIPREVAAWKLKLGPFERAGSEQPPLWLLYIEVRRNALDDTDAPRLQTRHQETPAILSPDAYDRQRPNVILMCGHRPAPAARWSSRRGPDHRGAGGRPAEGIADQTRAFDDSRSGSAKARRAARAGPSGPPPSASYHPRAEPGLTPPPAPRGFHHFGARFLQSDSVTASVFSWRMPSSTSRSGDGPLRPIRTPRSSLRVSGPTQASRRRSPGERPGSRPGPDRRHRRPSRAEGEALVPGRAVGP
jgi:hypothetical protein